MPQSGRITRTSTRGACTTGFTCGNLCWTAGYMTQMLLASTPLILSAAPEEPICVCASNRIASTGQSAAHQMHMWMCSCASRRRVKSAPHSAVSCACMPSEWCACNKKGAQCVACQAITCHFTPCCLMQGSGADRQDAAVPEPWILQLPGLCQPGPVLYAACPGGSGHLRLGRVLPACRSW
jgi:hypothetical protein